MIAEKRSSYSLVKNRIIPAKFAKTAVYQVLTGTNVPGGGCATDDIDYLHPD